MRPLLFVIGVIVVLLGAAWALQGAYVLPATFMRGPEWVAIGGGVATLGTLLVLLGLRKTSGPRDP